MKNFLSNASDIYHQEEVDLEDNIMIMYTSGTTGHPKGAMITHKMQLFNVINLGISAAVSPESVHLVVLPLFHTGVNELLFKSNSSCWWRVNIT